MIKLRSYISLVIGISLLLLTGCIRVENPDYGDKVKLYARMNGHLSVNQQTRSADGMEIGIIRLDEKNGGTMTAGWPYFINCTTPLTASLTGPDPEEGNLRTVTEFSTPQFFKNSTDKIRYAAWFPRLDNSNYLSNEDGTTLTFTIPTTGDLDILYSDVVEGTMSTGFDVMEFKHALSLFRIYAYSSSASVNWGSITSLELTDMPDKCTITLPSAHEPVSKRDHAIAYSKTTAEGITLTHLSPDPGVEIPDGFNNKAFIKEWIAAPATIKTLKGLNISVTTVSDEITKENNISIAQNFQPGYAYDIVLRFSDKGVINAEVKISDWPDGGNINSDISISETFFNLSANGTSNCYIVSSANFSYCFDATVKGNGSTAALAGASVDPTLDPAWVDIIWSEIPADKFKLETNKIVEGKVLFTLKGDNDINKKTLQSEGNVLLGVYDREGGNCLWTWHLWITDKPQKQNYKKGYIALDRNLGATAPAPELGNSDGMNGLFYQWGRPTPFHLVTKNGQKVVDANKQYTRVTPDKAISNPKTLYGRFENNATEDKTGDAFNHGMDVSGNYHDWVDRVVFKNSDNLWGYMEVEHVKPIKTLYDPCPHGYHVPYQRHWESMEAHWSNKPEDPITEEKWKALQGIQFKIENDYIWYPFQGYINKDGEYLKGHIHMEENGGSLTYEAENTPIVEVWSSLINRHDNSNQDDDSPYRFLFTKDYGAMLSDQYSNRSRGLAIRCVSNNTADVVKDLSSSQTANCYIVDTTGFFKFKTTVRGNGVGSLLPLGGTTTAEINAGLSTNISPSRVDILWWQGDFTKAEDFPNNETTQNIPPANMCIELMDGGIISSDGYAAFQISEFKKGNAIIAAYNDAGVILWTWHIWLTDMPDDVLSGNYTKQDRFLGATFAPDCSQKPIVWKSGEQQATLGFYYQWGRKDPIIGPPGISNGDYTTTGSTTPSAGWWIKEGDVWRYRKTIDVKGTTPVRDVVKDPTAFYKSTTRKDAPTSQWFPDTFADGYTNVAMWGYAVADYSIEGQTFSKTMYDPCPPGYRTPFHFSWRYNSSEKYAEGDLGEATTDLTTAEKGYDNYGIVTNKTHFHKMWFPFGGYRDPLTGNYTDVGEQGYMNTGMPMGQYNTRSFWFNNTRTGQYAGQHGSAYGKMIRCMKE